MIFISLLKKLQRKKYFIQKIATKLQKNFLKKRIKKEECAFKKMLGKFLLLENFYRK